MQYGHRNDNFANFTRESKIFDKESADPSESPKSKVKKPNFKEMNRSSEGHCSIDKAIENNFTQNYKIV